MPMAIDLQNPVLGPQQPVAEKEGRIHVAGLDGFRGVVALFIIAKHYGLPDYCRSTETILGRHGGDLLQALSGVDFFFVLSGFLHGNKVFDIMGSAARYKSFYLRRACRTFPLYFLLLASYCLAVCFPHSAPFNGLDWPFATPWSIVAYAAFVQNMWMCWADSLGPPSLEITWSLAVLEQFYLLLPLIPRYVGNGRAALTILACAALLAPVLRWVGEANFRAEIPLYDCLLPCRMDTLCLGVLAAMILRNPCWHDKARRFSVVFGPSLMILLIGFVALAKSHVAIGGVSIFILNHTYLAALYVTVILAAVFKPRSWIVLVLNVSMFPQLGRISYGLFLFHEFVFVFTSNFVGIDSAGYTSEWLLVAIISLVLTILLAEFLWRAVEKPLVDWGRRLQF